MAVVAAISLVIGLSFVSGYVAGAVWRRLFADRGFGILHVSALSVLASSWLVLTWLIVGSAYVVLWERTGTSTSFWTTAALFWPAALVGFTVARRRRHRTRVARRRHVTAGAGSHEITPHMRRTMTNGRDLPPPPPPVDDRPLPTPFGVGNRSIDETDA